MQTQLLTHNALPKAQSPPRQTRLIHSVLSDVHPGTLDVG
jgi:hypothetical protein